MPANSRTLDTQSHARAVEVLLRAGPRSAQYLIDALGVSQPTLSRTIQGKPELFTAFRISGKRTPQYALLRRLHAGLNPRQTVYRILASGAMEPFADIEFLAGGGTLERGTHRTVLYLGLPPYMAFASPSGFLGRQIARDTAAELQLPANLRDWSDDHRLSYLFARGLNLAGNLAYGETALQREMDLRDIPPTPTADKLRHHVARG